MITVQPRIAIPIPTSHDEAYNRMNWPVYAEVIRYSRGEPIAVPLDLSDSSLNALCETVDGILLPGSPADVDPALYAHLRDQSSAPADPARERTDRFLLQQASLDQKPLLAICFGMQMLNVVHGGTLIQDLAILPVNHPAARSVQVAHTVVVKPSSWLESLVDSAEAKSTSEGLRLPVNSSHHQAVGVLGQGLAVVARCPQDGVVEAIERAPPTSPAIAELTSRSDLHSPQTGPLLLIGVQWHPERTFATSATSRALFASLVSEAARAHRPA